LRRAVAEAVVQAGCDDAVSGRGVQHLMLAEISPQHGGNVQSGVGGADREVVGQRTGERLGEDVMALAVDSPGPADVLVEQAVVDEAGHGGLNRDRRMPVDELPQRGDRLGQ
jgi:hypothetical protein